MSSIFDAKGPVLGRFNGCKMKISLGGAEWLLLPEKAGWLPDSGTMVVADLHFGKAHHFRRAGLPVPARAAERTAEALIELLMRFTPQRVIFLGDLFHSHYNDDWETVGQIVRHFPGTRFELVRGNHDIMSERQYERQGIVLEEAIRLGVLLFTHEPMSPSDIPSGMVNVAGHIHPGARLEGRGKQSLVLPCYWRTAQQFILPAFGALTGLASIRPQAGDGVYLVADGQVMEWDTKKAAQAS